MVSSYWEVKSLTERQSDLAVRSKPAIKPRAREKVKARTESNTPSIKTTTTAMMIQ
jgi:hypothetical protein